MSPKKSSRKRSNERFRKRYGVGRKLVKSRTGNKQIKYEEKKSIPASIDRGSIPVTPQMIRLAVKDLHTKRVFVSSSMIANYLQRFYPIESDSAALKQELEDKLEAAVCVGLIAKCGADVYCLPTLRQQANAQKTKFTAFWEIYNKRGSRGNTLENTRKKMKKPLQSDLTDYTDDDEESDIA